MYVLSRCCTGYIWNETTGDCTGIESFLEIIHILKQ